MSNSSNHTARANSSPISPPLTRVLLTFIPDRVNVWLRFGNPVRERFIDRYRRQADFTPDQLLCHIHWQANTYGTTLWRLKVLRTVAPGEHADIVAGIAPGAEILLNVSGAAKVEHALSLIDAIEAQQIAPVDVPIAYWRVAHNRYAAHLEPPVYDAQRHAAHRNWRAFD